MVGKTHWGTRTSVKGLGSGSYSGTLNNKGKAHGHGTFNSKNGAKTYIGTFNANKAEGLVACKNEYGTFIGEM